VVIGDELMPHTTRLFAVFLALAFVLPIRAADGPPNDKLNTKIADVTLADAAGKPVSLHGPKDRKAVVIVFLSFECPVSNGYAPVLAELAKTYEGKGVAFFAVDSSDDGDAAQIAKLAADYKLPFPVLKDKNRAAADAFKAVTVSEAFVLDHNNVLRYRGRIDDGYTKRLVRAPRVTRHDLKDALDDLLAGKDVRTPATAAVGCLLPSGEEKVATGKVTYHRDVLPILQARCQECHRPGEVGPFSLLTYKQAVNWAADIKEYTASRQMPPWKPVEGVAFHNDRRMADKEIATLAAWVDGGTPEGEPKDAPKPRVFPDGWRLGKPDLVLSVPEEMTIGAGGRDLFRVYVLPTKLDEDRVVSAVEVRPGNNRVVHHTLNFWDTTGRAREKEKEEIARKKADDEQDHGPGYSSSMGVGIRPQAGKFGGMGGWAPGNLPRYLPEGAGWTLPKGADVVVQVHYHRTGRVEKDQLRIGLYFSKKPLATKWKDMVVPGRFLFIPAGEDNFTVKDGVEVLADCTVHSVMPHMHMLGKSIKVTVTPPEGKPFTLVAIKEWNYNWQETYTLKEPLTIKAGTKLNVEAVYDNSAKNPSNPFNPPRLVPVGEQTDNEMCFVFLGCTSDQAGRVPVRLLNRAGDQK
jgi:peroxiredoxin